jgi:hypothetical protein
MAEKSAPPAFKVGDMVKIRYSGVERAKIVEWRGPLGPGGAQVYRLLVRRKPKPVYIEVLEEQLVPLPAKE